MSAPPRRTTRNLGNTAQGSAFHELVVVPTLAPELARPYQVPGTDIVFNRFGSIVGEAVGRESTADAGDAVAENGTTQSTGDQDQVQPGLYVHVTLEWTERAPKSTRNNARTKKMHESKLVSKAVDVLSISRVEFIPIALGAHGYDDVYVAGVASGPSMRMFWAGSPGGKGGATVILYDKDWEIVTQKLADALKSSKRLDTISVVFDLDGMDGFKQRQKRLHSPDSYEPELAFGTHVPNTDNYTPIQLALGGAIDEIKAAHSCVEHGICFIDANGEHIEINRFRSRMWGQAVVSGQCAAKDAPPNELLKLWTGNSGSASTSKPRGRTGPHPAMHLASTSSSETANLLLTTMVPMVAMMAQNMTTKFSAAPGVPRAVSRSPVRMSSPPPAIDLEVFMDAFGRAKKISAVRTDAAKTQLKESSYTPDILSESSVTSERLGELTGFAEGEVHQLKKFARQWTSKVEGKRVRRGIVF
ncbi:hypothetical protein B0H16DRAFT_1741745 [Mycena metata]|uniref:Uncharacterized protein n=1 Tax=Mycena metata TaxID=1033252 RepID=A0AAD7MFS2_9AGAR|nr:hypothetical protein B0H16DRAFT_1741745 [Mycena metata]